MYKADQLNKFEHLCSNVNTKMYVSSIIVIVVRNTSNNKADAYAIKIVCR